MTALHLAAQFGHTNVLLVLEDKVPWTSVSTKVHDTCRSLASQSLACSVNDTVLFFSLAILDPRVGHTVDVLSPFIPVLCHSD